MIDINIDTLLYRIADGDSAAFGELYMIYRDDMYRFALYYTGCSQDAQDAVQYALLEAWKGIHSLKDKSAFKSWLFKILYRECCKVLKSRYKNEKVIPIDMADDIVSSDNTVELSELKGALMRLKKEERAIVTLSKVSGFTSDEIGALMNMPSSSVRSKLKRALEKLKKELL